MKRALAFVLLVLIVGLAVPTFAQGELNRCDPAGTWVGGSAAKYLMTIIPGREYKYVITWQAAFKPLVPVLTSYTGTLEKQRGEGYVAYSVAMINKSDAAPVGNPLPASIYPEVWALRAWLVFSEDCNSIESTIDFWGAYLWQSEKLPFVDPPDQNRLAAGPITETYRRIGTDCPQCP